MSWKDKAKESRGKEFPKMEVDMHIESKANPNGQKASFSFWDKEKEERKFTTKTISGILVGEAMVAEAFDDNLGRNGGTYRTGYYFNNNNVTLFGGGQAIITGPMADVEAWVNANTTSKRLTKKRVFFVATTGHMLIAVTTNMTLAIDQMKRVDRDMWLDYEINLTPEMYLPGSDAFSKRAHEMLGKFGAKNPPCYASVSQGKPIDDTADEDYGIEKHMDMFLAFKNHITAGAADSGDEPAHANGADTRREQVDANVKMHEDSSKFMNAPDEYDDPEVPDDDLPF